jgi:hypothetical protein
VRYLVLEDLCRGVAEPWVLVWWYISCEYFFSWLLCFFLGGFLGDLGGSVRSV